MSAPKNISVFRNYQTAPEACSQALTLLLKASVRKEAATTSRPDAAESHAHEKGALPSEAGAPDAAEESENGCDAYQRIIPQ